MVMELYKYGKTVEKYVPKPVLKILEEKKKRVKGVKSMKIIGLTGTSGAGKSTVSEILMKKYGAEIIDADKVAKKLSKKGTMYTKSIIKSFGDEILDWQGELNRKKLANIIYEDEKKREQLNQLTFIYVVGEIKKQINKLNHKKIIVIDAPLLFESKLNQVCDFVIAVIANKEKKIERICKRDGISREEAILRLNAQNTDEFFKENSDYILYNQEEKEDLENQIASIKILQ